MIKEAIDKINERGWSIEHGIVDIKKELQIVSKKDSSVKQSINRILKDIDKLDLDGIIESLTEGIFDFFKKADKKHKVSKKTTAEDDVNHILSKIDKLIKDSEYENGDEIFMDDLESIRIKISNLYKWK